MRTNFFIFIILLIVRGGTAMGQSHIQLYEVGVMDMNGTDGYFYFSYEISKKISSDQYKINFINKRLSEELVKIADEYAVYDLIQLIDSIGPKIENKLDKDLKVNSIKVLEIGVFEFIKSYLVKNGINDDRVKTIESAEIKNSFSYFDLKSEEKSNSEDFSINVNSKYGSEVIIEYNIYFLKKKITKTYQKTPLGLVLKKK